ncbi:Putative peptidoglycan binding domain-containing protein [Rhodovulum sp. ES.010]|uniref:peptidoglycan-binding domain-containing protein n=1 Tax=Rhodovulum sp. ES.010 TaxID=1882821 RepID=UPI00092BA69C|nr:peptidoglycan-binding domain-containing protein [Rhodovulum sp. ES.010]SIO37589.1 Putative peptidoglycan binding domain-containing protein [Rhodovulum sp. ES.010]
MKKQFAMACVATSLVVTPASRAAADAGDIAGGIIGGIIGGAIINEATKKKKVYRKTYRPSSGISSATREQNREVQTSLNYFGFPAGTVDGVLGRNSRNAISQYQAHMGYPATGKLTPYERDFLVTSYHRAIAGGPSTSQMIAANPQGPRGLLKTYQQQLATGGMMATQPMAPAQPGTTVVINPQPQAAPQGPVAAAAPALSTLPAVTATAAAGADGAAKPALPTFLGQGGGQSLNSHCNKVNLVTSSNGGFTTSASMTDASFALEEQFCLARTYAIAGGEEIAAKITGVGADQIAEQCAAFGPALKEHVAALSFDPMDTVVKGVRGFVLESGMSPAQLAGTAKVCLSVAYRTDNMDVAIGSGLLLVALGETVYAELMGHHLAQGFGTARRTDLALDWYDAALGAVESGTAPVFAPGQPERSDLLRNAAYRVGGRSDGAAAPDVASTPQPAALPTFTVDN